MSLRLATCAFFVLFCSACTGEIDGVHNAGRDGSRPGSSGTTGGADLATGDRSKVSGCTGSTVSDPGIAISRRLTRTDYDNTVRDLLGDTSAPATTTPTAFPGEELSRNFDNNPEMLSVSAPLVQAYFDAAEAVSTKAVQNLSGLVGACAATGGPSCADQFIRSFGARAFRRPLTDEDVTRFMAPFNVGSQTDFKTGIRLVVSAMLQSAPFLYRLEFGGATAGAYRQPTSYEMASRLSYFLWKSMPDAMLFQAAQSDQLKTPDQIRTEAIRMVGAMATKAMVGDFHDQWLSLRLLDGLDKSTSDFPAWGETIAADMHTEASRFIEDVLFSGSGDVSNLLSAPYTFLNGNLSQFYGWGPGGAGSFMKTTPASGERAGVLTLGSTMAIFAKSNRTSPVLRGKFVREQIMCEEIPPPPPNVPALPEVNASLSVKQRLGEHEIAGCAACHVLMDPIGWTFENYDAVGRFRTSDNKLPIDATGDVRPSGDSVTDPAVVGAFSGPAELGRKLAASDEVKRCVVTQWFRYASGRTEADSDLCALQKLDAKFANAGHSVKELMVELTQTDAFLYRRAN